MFCFCFCFFNFPHLRSFRRPPGGLQFEPLAPALSFLPPSLKAHHFSFPRILSPSSAGTKMEDRGQGWGNWEGISNWALHPPPTLSPAPTWAYPCSLLLHPILAVRAPPRHLTPRPSDLQRAGVKGSWTVAKRLAPTSHHLVPSGSRTAWPPPPIRLSRPNP